MVVERLLVWLCGENYEVMRFYPRDKAPYLLIGLLIVGSAALAGMAVLAVLQLLWSVPLAVQILLVLLAVLASMGLDRFLVTAFLRRKAGPRTFVAVVIPRGLLGVVSALCAATLVVTHLAAFDVGMQITAIQHQDSQAFYAALYKSKLAADITAEEEFVTALKRPDAKVQNLEAQLQFVRLQEQAAYQNYNCLRYGGTCKPGDESAADLQEQEYEVTARQASQISAMISSLESKDAAAAGKGEAKLPFAESQLASNLATEAKLIRSFQASNNHPGLQAKLSAVVQASDRGWARIAWWALIFLAVIVACLPTVLKWRLTRKQETQYEIAMYKRLLESREAAWTGRREEGGLPTIRVGDDAEADAEAWAPLEEVYRMLAKWDRDIPTTQSEVTDIGSQVTNALVRDWQNRRRRQ